MAGKARIGKVAVETLQKAGCLNGMPRSEQLDMFDLLQLYVDVVKYQ